MDFADCEDITEVKAPTSIPQIGASTASYVEPVLYASAMLPGGALLVLLYRIRTRTYMMSPWAAIADSDTFADSSSHRDIAGYVVTTLAQPAYDASMVLSFLLHQYSTELSKEMTVLLFKERYTLAHLRR